MSFRVVEGALPSPRLPALAFQVRTDLGDDAPGGAGRRETVEKQGSSRPRVTCSNSERAETRVRDGAAMGAPFLGDEGGDTPPPWSQDMDLSAVDAGVERAKGIDESVGASADAPLRSHSRLGG